MLIIPRLRYGTSKNHINTSAFDLLHALQAIALHQPNWVVFVVRHSQSLLLWCRNTITAIRAKQAVCEIVFSQGNGWLTISLTPAKWWLVMVWLSLPKLHIANLTGFAKISGLYISDLKIKDLSIPYRHQQADDHVKRIAERSCMVIASLLPLPCSLMSR